MASISILEDYLPLSRLMSDYLRTRGHSVSTASSAMEGLAKIQRDEPDIALVDLSLGEEDGLAVIRKAKASGCKTKFLIVTGNTDVRSVVDAMKCGASDYCTKPFRLDALHDVIEECLEHCELPMQNSRDSLAYESTHPTQSTTTTSGKTLSSDERKWWHTLKESAVAQADEAINTTRVVVLRGATAALAMESFLRA